MSDIVFLDTETLGLHPDAPIWEFAAVRRPGPAGQHSIDIDFILRHDDLDCGWLEELPEPFAADYRARYDWTTAAREPLAVKTIHQFTRDAHIIGANPSFDTERLAKLLRRHNIEPAWHYHLIDIENVIVGYLAAQHRLPVLPYKSDELSAAIGIDAADYARHTAAGDVAWVMAQWDAVMRCAR